MSKQVEVELKACPVITYPLRVEPEPGYEGVACILDDNGVLVAAMMHPEHAQEIVEATSTRVRADSTAPGVVNLEAWTSIDAWLRENPKATVTECLAELVRRIKVEAAAASLAPKGEEARDQENSMNTVTFATSANIANPDVSCPKCGGTKPTCCSCPEAKYVSMAELVREFTQAAINAHVGFKHESRWHDCDYASCSKWREMIDTLNTAITPPNPIVSDCDPD